MFMLRILKLIYVKSIASVYTILSVYCPGLPGNLPCLFLTLRINIFVQFGLPDLDNATESYLCPNTGSFKKIATLLNVCPCALFIVIENASRTGNCRRVMVNG